MTTFSYAYQFADTYLASRFYTTGRPCLVCEQEADEARGWIKSRKDSDHRWWLCNSCLDQKPTVKWKGDAPHSVSFPSPTVVIKK